jgi:hypothetical protein
MTVFQTVSGLWADYLEQEVQALDVETEVGRSVVEYLRKVEAVLELTEESDEFATIARAAARQCNVWFFG